MLGLDFAGKTTILYKLKLGEVIQTIPTIGLSPIFSMVINIILGFNVETIQYKKLKLQVWDVTGSERIRRL